MPNDGSVYTTDGNPSISIEGKAAIAPDEPDADDTTEVKPSRFSMTANTGAPMKLSGWKYPVVMDMEGIHIPHQNVPIRMEHDPRMGVGHTDKVYVDGGKLMASGIISRSTEAARDVRESAKQGFPWRASIGASADKVEFVKAGYKATVNGQEYEGPINIARKSSLGEISFVDMGADPHTDAMIAKIAASKDSDDDSDSSSDGQRSTKQITSATKRERKRLADIAAMVEEAASYRGADVEAIEKIGIQAEEEGWDIQKTELAILRATRPRAPQRAQGEIATPKVLEASLCMACGVSDEVLAKDRDYGPEVTEKAWPLRSRGLRGTIGAALEASGQRVPHGSKELYDAILDHQRHNQIQAAGFSTINLPGILGNVANKVLLEAFVRVDATYDRIADQADYSNFYMHSIFRLQASGDFALVPPDGELKHGTLEQDYFTNKLDTRGLMLTITRQDIINDDLNSFRSLTAQLARRARIAVEKSLYLLVAEDTDVFYTVARGNRLTGPLGITELGAAEGAMLAMKDINGDPIYAQPRFLVVPSTLKFMGEQIWTSQNVMDFTTNKSRPTDNPFRGRFEVINTPFLNAATIPGYSPTTWYLLADPLMLAAFQVAYLDGRRAPTIETADALFNVLGLQMRAYWDYGVARLDYRGAIKSTAS